MTLMATADDEDQEEVGQEWQPSLRLIAKAVARAMASGPREWFRDRRERP